MKKTTMARARHYPMLSMAAMVTAAVIFYGAVMGATVLAQGAEMYLNPPEQTVAEGESFNVEIRVDAGEEAVNAAGALVEYPVDTFELNEVDADNSDFEVEATNETNEGSVEIVRGSTEPQSGDLLLASLMFTMTREADSAAVTLNEAESNVVRESDNTDILGHTSGAAFGVAPDLSAHVTEDESGSGSGSEGNTQMIALLAAGGTLALLIIAIVVGLVLRSRSSGNSSTEVAAEVAATQKPPPESEQATNSNQDEQASSAPTQPGQQVKPGSRPPNDETKQ